MEIVWIVLLVFAVLVVLGLLVGGAFMLIMRLRSGASLSIDIRGLVRLYLYVGIIAGLLVFTQGASELINAGAAGIAGKDFSYHPVWVELPEDKENQSQHPLELADRSDLSAAQLEELSVILAKRNERNAKNDEERDRLGLDRAFDEGLIEGISFAIIGGLGVGRAHVWSPLDRGARGQSGPPESHLPSFAHSNFRRHHHREPTPSSFRDATVCCARPCGSRPPTWRHAGPVNHCSPYLADIPLVHHPLGAAGQIVIV